jgi:hypothetical protein
MTRRSQHSRNKEGEASVDCGRVKRIASRSSDGAARGDDIHALQPSPCSKFCSRNAREPPTARLSISEPGVQPPRHVTIRFHVLPMSCASWTGGPALGRSHAWAFTNAEVYRVSDSAALGRTLSLRALAAKLTAEGLPTPAGSPVWTAMTVARVKAKLAA